MSREQITHAKGLNYDEWLRWRKSENRCPCVTCWNAYLQGKWAGWHSSSRSDPGQNKP